MKKIFYVDVDDMPIEAITEYFDKIIKKYKKEKQ